MSATSRTNSTLIARTITSIRRAISAHRAMSEIEAMPHHLRKDIGWPGGSGR